MNIITNFGEGRLGNQMFQYAFLAAKKAYFGINFYLPNCNLCEVFNFTPSSHQDYLSASACPELLTEKHSIVLDQRCLLHPTPAKYQGYFQSYKYFGNVMDKIRDQFVFRDPIDLPDEVYGKSLCIHVRRTDYLHSHVEDYWGNLYADGYYERAMERVGSYDTIYVCSDDIDWCREQKLFHRKNLVLVAATPSRTLQLMSKVHTNIISNSTFAWWGAFLNRNGNTYMPSFWRGPKALDEMGIDYYSNDLKVPGWNTVMVYQDKL
jgi:hypothetical protein